jgi:hypothetical protein
MSIGWQEQWRPGAALREIVQQATKALVCMDAERLEELARCCADLNREIEKTGKNAEAAVALQDAASDVKLLGRVLYETRANLTVLSRLHVIRLQEAGALRQERTRKQSSYRASALGEWNQPERKTGYGDN